MIDWQVRKGKEGRKEERRQGRDEGRVGGGERKRRMLKGGVCGVSFLFKERNA